MIHSCYLNIWEVETGGAGFQDQHQLHSEFKANVKHVRLKYFSIASELSKHKVMNSKKLDMENQRNWALFLDYF